MRHTRSTSVKLVKHINPIKSALDISWITSEPPGECFWFKGWNLHIRNIQKYSLSEGRAFCRIDSMTRAEELADDMIPTRMFIRLHIELVGWYSCPREYGICKPIILPREPSIANKLHGFEKSDFFSWIDQHQRKRSYNGILSDLEGRYHKSIVVYITADQMIFKKRLHREYWR